MEKPTINSKFLKRSGKNLKEIWEVNPGFLRETERNMRKAIRTQKIKTNSASSPKTF